MPKPDKHNTLTTFIKIKPTQFYRNNNGYFFDSNTASLHLGIRNTLTFTIKTDDGSHLTISTPLPQKQYNKNFSVISCEFINAANGTTMRILINGDEKAKHLSPDKHTIEKTIPQSVTLGSNMLGGEAGDFIFETRLTSHKKLSDKEIKDISNRLLSQNENKGLLIDFKNNRYLKSNPTGELYQDDITRQPFAISNGIKLNATIANLRGYSNPNHNGE